MESFLQIAPHSLAIVLSRVVGVAGGGGGGTGDHHHHGAAAVSESDQLPRHHTGYEIFADFKAENTQQQHHVWNGRIAEAVKESFFLGWIDEHVLLIQGKEDHLEALREGWMRRSLNPPRGFTIKYLGDVSPISMSPISQSQFIPLGEVLLLAISAMNSAHKPVTQEALTDHLQTCFPGVPTPTEEVLHHTLSMLVRERKIYPTPDGYFIVTPQTYFITPSLIRTSSKWYHLDERSAERHGATQHQQTQCTSPLSGTVTPSTSGGAVVVGGRGVERTHPKPSQNHSGGGDSSYNNSYRDDPPSHHTTLQRRSPKDHREAPYPSPHPSPQTPPTQAGGGVATTTEKTRSTLSFPFKTDTLTKHRGGGGSTETEHKTGGSGSASRKFGLKLFRLSFKKDKTKQLATFSAQFPPVEWPLRDEEAPSALPRTVEMEIIRRINPDLTVENLARHTAVMKRLEEERAQRSKASSANQSSRSRRSGGGGGRHRKPSQTKAARSHSKARSSGRGGGGGGTGGEPGDELATTPGDRDYRAYSSSLARSPREHAVAAERQRARMHLAHSNPNILDASAHLPQTPEWDVSGELAKRRTEMPFPEPSHGPSAHHPKVHRSHSHTQERKSRGERSGDKAKERSRSMDNSKGPLGGGVGLAGPPDYYEDRGSGRYYTDDGTLRAAAAAANQGSSSHYSRLAATPPTSSSSNKLTAGGGDSSHHGGGGRSLERKCKSRDSVLPAYSPKPPHRGVAASSAAPGASASASSSALPLPLLADDTDYFPGERGGEMPLPLSSLLAADGGNHAGAAPPGTLGRKGGGGGGHDERQTDRQMDRQTDRQTPRPPATDYKEEGGKGGGSLPPMPLDPHPPALLSNGRLPHTSQGGGGSAQEKQQQQQRKEIFSKDTLFKPPPSMPCSLPPSMPCSLPGYSSLRKPCSGSGGGLAPPPSASALSSSSCDAMLLLDPAPFQDSAPKPLVASVLMPPPQQPPPRDDAATGSSSGGAAEASSSFDYYNVSDDEELDEGMKRGADGKTGGGMGGGLGPGSGGGGVGMGGMMGGVGAGGTMQWLLEREKERDLQRRFERNLTFPSSSSKASASKENSLPDHHHHHHVGHHHSQQGAHSARLDSMDSSSVTVDSGFNSPRTRESLASNTSSIVESNRRQNLALSPGHLGGGAPGTGPPPFSFRAVPEPPLPAAPNPDKLQKAGACLASITSV